MGRKKKKQTKPWCWYCNREFDDEKILIQHQKAKHFKCPSCHKKLYTGPGLSIHCMQVHKETIDKVPNSLPSRNNIEIEIYGMEGIPDDDLREHERQKQGRGGGAFGGKRGLSDDEDSQDGMNSGPPNSHQPPIPAMPPTGPMGHHMPRLGAPMMGAMVGHMGPMGHFMGHPPGMVGPPILPMGAHLPPPGHGLPPASSSQLSQPNSKPLFPSAVQSSGANEMNHAKPAFPAYGHTSQHSPIVSQNSVAHSPHQSTLASIQQKKPSLITTVSGNSRIIHPEEDVSLEEKRAAMARYQPVGGGVPKGRVGGAGPERPKGMVDHPSRGTVVPTPPHSRQDAPRPPSVGSFAASPIAVSSALPMCLPRLSILSPPPASAVSVPPAPGLTMLSRVAATWQEEHRAKMPKYALSPHSGVTILQPTAMMRGHHQPHPGGVVIEAPPMVSAAQMVSTMGQALLPGTLVSMPQPIMRPAMHVMSAPIMTAAMPMPASAVPPLPIGGMRPHIGIHPQGIHGHPGQLHGFPGGPPVMGGPTVIGAHMIPRFR